MVYMEDLMITVTNQELPIAMNNIILRYRIILDASSQSGNVRQLLLEFIFNKLENFVLEIIS